MWRTSAVVAAMLALAGCASSTGTTRGTTAAGPASTRATAGQPIPNTQAGAFVAAVTLHPADMPGFKASTEAEHETFAEQKLGHALEACVGTALSHEGVAEGQSPNLEREASGSIEGVASFAEVARSPTAAAQALAITRSPRASACLSKFLTKQFASTGHRFTLTVAPFSVVRYTPQAHGTLGTFGWRFSTTLSAHGRRLPIRFDISGFGYRTALVALFTAGFPRPFPATQENRLFSLLVGRAQGFH